jgi:Phosphatidylglycerol lysyltransferase, C-terminal
MEFFEDIVFAKPVIEEAIETFGYAAEHNYFWYQYYLDPDCKNIFVKTDVGCLFTTYNEKKQTCWVVFDPLALPEHRASLLAEYLDWAFTHMSVKKIWLQLETPVRKELLTLLPAACRSNPVYFTLVWPVYDLEAFDCELPGGHYKTLRKEMHKFYREHVVTVADAKTFEDSALLHRIVDDWAKRRPNPENASVAGYHNIIDGKFEGADEARILLVDGVARGFNAGWMVPHSDRFYGAIGIHDYSLDDLGTILYLEDLFWLKKKGYRETDMAGSEKPLLAFKNKFCSPKYTYSTSHFSIVRRAGTIDSTGV